VIEVEPSPARLTQNIAQVASGIRNAGSGRAESFAPLCVLRPNARETIGACPREEE
jgi:hypothetical protein